MVDAWGHVQQRSVYYPFGGERVITNNVANNYKFTGLERDSETGLDHTLNRQYSSNLGRWSSPDPVRGCGENPQKFDRYNYVLDNPATLTDPKGDQPDDFQNPDCSDVEFATSHAECRTIPDPSGEVLGGFEGRFGFGGGLGIFLAHTTYKFDSVAGGLCKYNIDCGKDKHSCGRDSILVAAPCPKEYEILSFVAYRSDDTVHCFPIGLAFASDVSAGCQ